MNERALRHMSAWRRWRALPASERRLVPTLFFLLPAVAVAIQLLGVRGAYALFSRRPPLPQEPTPAGAAQARDLARLVAAAARRLPGHPTCLTRSVTLWYLLRRRGMQAALRLGVRTVDGRLEAHAWVQFGEEVVNDEQDVGQRFAAFEKLDLDSRTL